MDLLAHACYGATVCSRSGLAGGKNGAGMRWFKDSSVWWSVFFGLLPDMLSMWVPFAVFAAGGAQGNFFHFYDGAWLEVYHLAHSLIPSLCVTLVLVLTCRRLALASLAWSVHIICDAVSHDGGKFSTMMFFPLSRWHIEGIAFWRNGWFVACYWNLLAVLWIAIILWRSHLRKSGRVPGSSLP